MTTSAAFRESSRANLPTSIYSLENSTALDMGVYNMSAGTAMPGYLDELDYEYEYQYMDNDVGNVPTEELVPVSLTYGLTLVLGLLGNTLVIVSVAKFKKMQNVTNMFLLSLASADLLLVLICIPVKVSTNNNTST